MEDAVKKGHWQEKKSIPGKTEVQQHEQREVARLSVSQPRYRCLRLTLEDKQKFQKEMQKATWLTI